MRKNPNIQMLEIVALGLGELREEIVFVGGTTTAFYITDPASTEIRPTDDVDCIIELASVGDYYQMEKRLRKLGFKNQASSEKNLLCRWDYKGITVDVMPTDGTVVGFTNRWYPDGMRAKEKVQLPSKTEIYVLPLPYFIGTKFEAFAGRGQGDYRTSHDIEDIVTVLDGSIKAEHFLNSAPDKLKEYLRSAFKAFIQSDEFEESLFAHMSRGGDLAPRVRRISKLIGSF